jgi:hypothetical protein
MNLKNTVSNLKDHHAVASLIKRSQLTTVMMLWEERKRGFKWTLLFQKYIPEFKNPQV